MGNEIPKKTITDMEWPTLANKLNDARFIKWPAYAGFFVDFRNWYFGFYILISFGWFAFICGEGTYD